MNSNTIDTTRLVAFFNELYKPTEQDIPGVTVINSGLPGPTVGITVCTHGNEPSGLVAATYIRERIQNETPLLCGRVVLVVNNPGAVENYLRDGERAAHGGRFIDADMNRLPADLSSTEDPVPYEVRRAQELVPVWQQFDVGLDIHSTTLPTSPMLVVIGGTLHTELVKGFPIENVLTNIDAIQIGKPAPAFYGTLGRSRAMSVEAGSHTDPASYECARVCVQRLLENLEMLPRTTEAEVSPLSEYEIAGSLILQDDSYEIVREFRTFEPITKGTVLARGNGADAVMPFDGHVLFHNGKPKPADPKSEALFFSKPVRHI